MEVHRLEPLVEDTGQLGRRVVGAVVGRGREKRRRRRRRQQVVLCDKRHVAYRARRIQRTMALVALRLRIMRRAAAADAGTAAVTVMVHIVVMMVVRVVRVRRRLRREATAAQHTDVARVARSEGRRRTTEQVVNRRRKGRLRRGTETQTEVVAVGRLVEARVVVASEAAVQRRHRGHIARCGSRVHRQTTTNRRGFGDATPKRRRRRGVKVATAGKAMLQRLVVHRLVVGRGVVQRREHRRGFAVATGATTQKRREAIFTRVGGQVVLPPRRRRLQSRSRRSAHHSGTRTQVGSGGGRCHSMHRGHGHTVTRIGTASRQTTCAHQHLLQLVANGTVVGDVVDGHLVQGLHGAQGRLDALGSQRVVNKAVAILDAHLGVNALLLQGHFDDLAEGGEELQDHLLGNNGHKLLR